jgi:hypothetical protein
MQRWRYRGSGRPRLSSSAYRQRLLKNIAPNSERFRNSRFELLDGPTLDLIEHQVYADASEAAHSRQAPGTLVPVEYRDPAGG